MLSLQLAAEFNRLWLWILISLVLGGIGGLIFINATKHSDNDDDDTETEEADDTNDVVHRDRNYLLVILVFSVLAFLILWLVMALFNERVNL